MLDRIQAVRSSFTPAQERIADFLLANTLNAALLTATELAQQLNVDPATVVRFAQKLGYAGYLELKSELGQMVRDIDRPSHAPPGSLGQTLENAHRSLLTEFSKLWDSFDKVELIQVVELLGMPSHLLLLSDSICSTTTEWLGIALRERGFRIDIPGEDPDALAECLLSPQTIDRALILEGMVPSPTLEHIAQDLQRKNVRSLAILGSAGSQVVRYVDTALHLRPLQDPMAYPTILQLLFLSILHTAGQLHNNNYKDAARGEEPHEQVAKLVNGP